MSEKKQFTADLSRWEWGDIVSRVNERHTLFRASVVYETFTFYFQDAFGVHSCDCILACETDIAGSFTLLVGWSEADTDVVSAFIRSQP